MNAVIMAGGEGTRLRPLTCDIPKPLVPLCGRPVSEYILELLKLHGFDEAVFTLRYLGGKIVSYFDDDMFNGIRLFYSFENEPLGTAGSVKNALKSKDAADGTLVISGDAMCDFNLSAAVDFHRKNKAAATIVVKKVPDPREYGLVLFDENGRVESFLEKPSFESCITDMANTGVYILSKEALEIIPDGQSDFAQDIFPLMLKKGMPLFAYEENGYWCDIGDFKSYMRCQQDMLNGLVKCELNAHRTLDGIFSGSGSDFKGARVTPPVYIGRDAKISAGAAIEAGSVIGDGVFIGRGAKIHGSIILDGAYIGEKVTCNEAVICKGARLLSSSAVFEGGVVGENALIGENSVVQSGVKIWTGKELERDSTASYDIKYGTAHLLSIDDDGVCGETNGEITPQVASVLGSALCSAGKKIAVGRTAGAPAKALCFALVSGIMSSGGEVWDLGECCQSELEFALRSAGLDIGCYVDAGIVTKFKISAENGLPLTRKQERKIEGGLNRSEYPRVGVSDFGNIIDAGSFKALYFENLLRAAPEKLNGIRAEVSTANRRISEIFRRIFDKINDRSGERMIFHVSSDGKRLSVYSDETGYVFYEKLLLLACLKFFAAGEDVALPYSAPAAADVLAGKFGAKVRRYYNTPVDGSDREARELAGKQSFSLDALELMLAVLSWISERGISLGKALAELPNFTAASRFVGIAQPPSIVLKTFCGERGGLGEGVVASGSEGRVLIRPAKTGKGVMMFVESYKAETASEICDFYEKLLNEKLKEQKN